MRWGLGVKLCGWAWAGCGAVACTVRDAPARPAERRESPREDVEARWIEVRGWGNVWMTSELFDVGQARAHLEGAVDPVSCPVCAYDERNREHHAQNAGRLF